MTSDLVQEVICQDSFNVRLLSIRNVQNLNHRKLQQVLQYAIRPTRPPNAPRLEGLYLFDTSSFFPNPYSLAVPGYDDHVVDSGYQWYKERGRVIKKSGYVGWASTINACRGIISFDAIACNGPRHWPPIITTDGEGPTPWYRHLAAHVHPDVATYSVGGCCKCNTAPEGFSEFGKSPLEDFPLLYPPPLHASSVKSAKLPSSKDTSDMLLLVRCSECIRNRHCYCCHKWWCEDCYELPRQSPTATGLPQPLGAGNSVDGGNQPRTTKVYISISSPTIWCDTIPFLTKHQYLNGLN